MSTALITGVTGQDGLYLTELLLSKGYRIIGAVRNVIEAEKKLPSTLLNKVELVEWDMYDQGEMIDTLQNYRPEELYNFAAYSSGSGMFDQATNIGDINGLAVTRILEAIRTVDSNIKFCQASSSEMFGEAAETPQSENSTFYPRSPYGAAKLYAHSMINIYRNSYGLFACSAILFNHESPRRGLGFVTRKISYGVAKIKLGLASEIYLGNLIARRDWGFAGDYVRAMWQMLQMSEAKDYILATGKTYSIAELCEYAFSHVGLNYKDFVCEDVESYREIENFQLVGNAKKAFDELHWTPSVNFQELIAMMVDYDMQLLAGKNNINKGG
ncbi:MAG: GDP-mannose 4,6-dehydratase [Gammaproteobacteria bacterium]|nr:GDP-mannose 4,6-dehydratase [Gammaproteobacteria bacterium]